MGTNIEILIFQKCHSINYAYAKNGKNHRRDDHKPLIYKPHITPNPMYG